MNPVQLATVYKASARGLGFFFGPPLFFFFFFLGCFFLVFFFWVVCLVFCAWTSSIFPRKKSLAVFFSAQASFHRSHFARLHGIAHNISMSPFFVPSLSLHFSFAQWVVPWVRLPLPRLELGNDHTDLCMVFKFLSPRASCGRNGDTNYQLPSPVPPPFPLFSVLR